MASMSIKWKVIANVLERYKENKAESNLNAPKSSNISLTRVDIATLTSGQIRTNSFTHMIILWDFLKKCCSIKKCTQNNYIPQRQTESFIFSSPFIACQGCFVINKIGKGVQFVKSHTLIIFSKRSLCKTIYVTEYSYINKKILSTLFFLNSFLISRPK
jgi:hypothetical protein